MTLKEIYQKFLDMSDSSRASYTANAAHELMDEIESAGFSGDTAARVVIDFFKLFVSADKNCDYREKDLFNKAFGLNVSFDQFYDITNKGSSASFVADMVKLAKAFSSDIRADIAMLGIAIMCADGTMTVAEQQLIDKIL